MLESVNWTAGIYTMLNNCDFSIKIVLKIVTFYQKYYIINIY